MKKNLIVFLVLLTVVNVGVFSQNLEVDGRFGSREGYSSEELQKAHLFWKVEGEYLYVGIKAATEGWVAVGLGSARMDGSHIYMGYFDDDSFFEEHLGRGHSHRKVDNERDVEYALRYDDEFTYMEFRVPKDDYISSGQDTLPVIVAYGNRKNFRAMHRYRDSTELTF